MDVPDKAPRQQVDELKDLVVAYAQQETIDPLKDLGRYIGWALGGAVMLGVGVVFVSIGLLRLLQTEGPDWLHENGWSTLYPYLIVLVLLAIGAGLTLRQTRKRPPTLGKSTKEAA
ncbi:MAG TPA: phage holin family protein [Acidimicrobiia bacterium]